MARTYWVKSQGQDFVVCEHGVVGIKCSWRHRGWDREKQSYAAQDGWWCPKCCLLVSTEKQPPANDGQSEVIATPAVPAAKGWKPKS